MYRKNNMNFKWKTIKIIVSVETKMTTKKNTSTQYKRTNKYTENFTFIITIWKISCTRQNTVQWTHPST